MRYLAGLGKERLFSRCLLIALLLCLQAAAQAVERIYYHVNDPSGSPVMVVDAEGAVVARYAYAPFGSQLAAQPAAQQRLGFVGGIRETPGLHYLKHRYYSPQLGRFYQPDPVTFLGRGASQINRYAYGLNDPYTFRDISGREFTQIPDEALSTLRVSGSDILAFQWLQEAFAGNIRLEDNRQLNNRLLQSYVEGQENFIKSGGLISLMVPGEVAFPARGMAAYDRVIWPPNRGFFGESAPCCLLPGTMIDRYGLPTGTFVAPAGTPFSMRSLPLSALDKKLSTYVVRMPIEAQAGSVAPWFGRPGGGLQFELSNTVQSLLNGGYIDPR